MISPESEDKNLLVERVTAFLSYFELVFDNDWSFTKSTICDDPGFRELFISENGTFLDPFPGEFFRGGKGDNWANRTQLLDKYRELRAFLISEGLYEPEE